MPLVNLSVTSRQGADVAPINAGQMCAPAAVQVNEKLGLAEAAAEAAQIAATGSIVAPSAFAPKSRTSFDEDPPAGAQAAAPDKAAVERILSDMAGRASSAGRMAMQTAHSANSELAGYWTVTKK